MNQSTHTQHRGAGLAGVPVLSHRGDRARQLRPRGGEGQSVGQKLLLCIHLPTLSSESYLIIITTTYQRQQTPPPTASNASTNANATTMAPQPPLLTVSLRPAKRARTLEEEHVETQTYALTEWDWGPVDTVGVCAYVLRLCLVPTFSGVYWSDCVYIHTNTPTTAAPLPGGGAGVLQAAHLHGRPLPPRGPCTHQSQSPNAIPR